GHGVARRPTGHLVAEVTSVVGRQREVAQVKRLLSGNRLVTLTGAGGTGKTRVAVRVAGELRRVFADGVRQVDLAELTDGSLVGYAVAQALSFLSAAQVPTPQLFADRAAAVVPGFALTPDNARAVAAICQRLDGLPLAIELAAAQLRTRSLEQLASGLGQRFRLLSSRHAIPRRHARLRDTFDWSYALCSPAERALWTRLSVFAGFDLDGATAVCSGPGLPAELMLDAVVGLVDKSVVLRDEAGGARYRLLETVREYGLDRLDPAERTRLRRRHCDWYLGLAERLEAEWFGPAQPRWSGTMRAEYP